jgi:hypothetical protein
MAKRSGGVSLSGVSAAQLMRELAKRRGKASEIRRERDRLAARVAKLDAQLRDLDASIGVVRGRGGVGVPQALTRRENKGTLQAALVGVLKGKEMGVTEAANAVRKAGYKTNAANFRTIVNACLIRHKNLFKKVSRGLYTAA